MPAVTQRRLVPAGDAIRPADQRWADALPEALRAEMIRRMSFIEFGDGGQICQQGQTPTHWQAVVSGAVRQDIVTQQGRRLTLCYLPPGAWICDESILLGSPLAYGARACGHTIVASLPAQQLRPLLAQHPTLACMLNCLQARRMRYLYKRQDELSTLPLRARLAKCLLELSRHFAGRPAWGGRLPWIDLLLTQDDLAVLLGASRQRVNRELMDMRRRGLVGIARQRWVVVDPAALQALAQGAPWPVAM